MQTAPSRSSPHTKETTNDPVVSRMWCRRHAAQAAELWCPALTTVCFDHRAVGGLYTNACLGEQNDRDRPT